MDQVFRSRIRRGLPWLAALFMFCTAQAALAQQQEPEADPPGRAGVVTQRQGSVVFAPDGDEEWTDLPPNRPLTSGDRLWTDRGARAEVHLGPATLHVGGESHLGVSALDDRAAQFILMQGSLNARVRDLVAGENFEIDTPNLALRAGQPGDYRVDVDDGITRVIVHSGLATVYGDGGQALQLSAGQQASFAGRALAQVQARPWQHDALAQWAGERNRAEDLSVSARHVPRGVVGYQQLDAHGSWGQDASLGTVWYPTTVAADWAPYRQGRWTWVDPWGWTWVDDAPWGFAPFHYGRWAMVGSRWAWVPGRLAPRPVYAPALVAFIGGDGAGLGIASGPAVGWYPLAPGEAWYPTYRTTPRYVSFVNFSIDLSRYPRGYDRHHWRRHGHAFTVVREDDFRRGRNVRDHWQRVDSGRFAQGRDGWVPGRPDFRDRRGERDNRFTPRLVTNPPSGDRLRFGRDQYVRPNQQDGRQHDWQRRDRQEEWQRRERAEARERQERAEQRDERREQAQERERRERAEQRDERREQAQERERREQAQQRETQGRPGGDRRYLGDRFEPDRDRDGRRDADRGEQRGQRDAATEARERQQREQQEREAREARERLQQERQRAGRDDAVREQAQAQREAQRQQREAEREARQQVREAREARQPQAPQRQPAAPVGRSAERERGDDRRDRGERQGRGDGDGRGRN